MGSKVDSKEVVRTIAELVRLRLMAGNLGYVMKGVWPKKLARARRRLVSGQHPDAIVLCCSDSRVPPELIFNASLGELFVVRVAGNVVAPVVLGSIEYAAAHFRVPLLLVMGHESCGAVTAAVSGQDVPANTESVVQRIAPAVAKARERGVTDENLLWIAVEENVRLQMRNLISESKVIRGLVRKGSLRIVGAVYELEQGIVRFLDERSGGPNVRRTIPTRKKPGKGKKR